MSLLSSRHNYPRTNMVQGEMLEGQTGESPSKEGRFPARMHATKVSVVIPAYNAEKFVSQAIASCHAQTLPAEILVVDDGSSDATASIAQRAGARVVKLGRNHGAAAALDVGIHLSSGAYVCWLSADDCFVSEDKLQRQVAVMENTGADLSYYSDFLTGDDLQSARLVKPPLNCLMDYSPVAAIFLHNPINGSSVMLKRSSIPSYGSFDASLGNFDADGDMWLRWARKGAKIVRIDGMGVFYRQHGSQASKQILVYNLRQMLVRVRFLFH